MAILFQFHTNSGDSKFNSFGIIHIEYMLYAYKLDSNSVNVILRVILEQIEWRNYCNIII